MSIIGPDGTRRTRNNGSGSGRGDNPHSDPRSAWTADQHRIAHADGFIGPRIGEVYGDGRKPGQEGMAPTLQGGVQRSPAFGPVHYDQTGQSGTAGSLAHLDNVRQPSANTRVFQHRRTGNTVSTWNNYEGKERVDEFGTTSSGSASRVDEDRNLTPYPGAGIDVHSDDYTDITDTVRGTDTYKRFKR